MVETSLASALQSANRQSKIANPWIGLLPPRLFFPERYTQLWTPLDEEADEPLLQAAIGTR